MNIDITSVSKKPEKLSNAAAAIYVITQEDIRRSGVTSIPEALRMAPGVQVARIDSNKWAISARGFNDRFANKLLVLIDGRSVYTPLFSGVYWDMQDTLLEDIERIEVIRGPGATLWGANAVNGVINIITKNAKETQGGLVTAGYGTEENGFGGFRYGGKIDDDTYYRFYTKYFYRDDFQTPSGDDSADEWDMLRGGFRIDSDLSDEDRLTVQGDIFTGKVGSRFQIPVPLAPYWQVFNTDDELAGVNLLSRWEHVISETSDMTLQAYYDRIQRHSSLVDELRNTFDIEFHHRFALAEHQEVIWGLGYRFTTDDIENGIGFIYDPNSRDDHLFSAFVQDKITLFEDTLSLTLGSKIEHNDYTGFEYQPNARLLWTPHERHTIWTAVSRAVRTPSRGEHDSNISFSVIPPGFPPNISPLPMFVAGNGQDSFGSEEILAYELGHRFLFSDRLSLDTSLFYNDYNHLLTGEADINSLQVFPALGYSYLPAFADNNIEGETYGVELAVDWRPLDWWRLKTAYSYLQIQLHLAPDSLDTFLEEMERESPHNQLSILSSMNISRNVAFDLWVRYVDNLPNFDVSNYITLDARLSWKPHDNVELSLIGQNLLDNQHPEFGMPLYIKSLPTEIERSVYAKVTWEF